MVLPTYRAGRPICRKVLKIMFWEVPPADWLLLYSVTQVVWHKVLLN